LLVKKEVFKCLDSLVDRLNHDSIVELLMWVLLTYIFPFYLRCFYIFYRF
jgi:hypothetical protein